MAWHSNETMFYRDLALIQYYFGYGFDKSNSYSMGMKN